MLYSGLLTYKNSASTISILLVSFQTNPRKRASHLNHIPGPKPIPQMGNALEFDPDNVCITMQNWARQYGDVYLLFMVAEPVVLVNDAKIARELINDRDGFQRGRFTWEADQRFIGTKKSPFPGKC